MSLEPLQYNSKIMIWSADLLEGTIYSWEDRYYVIVQIAGNDVWIDRIFHGLICHNRFFFGRVVNHGLSIIRTSSKA